MGDLQAQAIGNGLRLSKQKIVSLNMASNRLTNKGAVPLISSINPDLEELDLSHNPCMKLATYSTMSQYLMRPGFKLKKLNFEGNEMSDSACELLCEALEGNRSVTYLNLSKNRITD